MISAVKYLKGIELDPLATVQDFASYGKYTRPLVVAKFPDYSLKGNIFNVPVVFGDDLEEAQVIMQRHSTPVKVGMMGRVQKYQLEVVFPDPADTDYLPTFLVDRGTDARGAVAWLRKKFGLNAVLYEFSEIKDSMNGNEAHVFVNTEEEFRSLLKSVVYGDTDPRHRKCFMIASVDHDMLGRVSGVHYRSDIVHMKHLVGVPTSQQIQEYHSKLLIWDSAVPKDSDGLRSVDWSIFMESIAGGDVLREGAHFTVLST